MSHNVQMSRSCNVVFSFFCSDIYKWKANIAETIMITLHLQLFLGLYLLSEAYWSAVFTTL